MSVRHIGIALDVSFDTLKGIVHNHLPHQYKFSRKQINIDDSYDGSKLFTTISGACRAILCSTDPDQHDVIDILLKDNYLQDKGWKAQKNKACGT